MRMSCWRAVAYALLSQRLILIGVTKYGYIMIGCIC
jgi:hypothetical protein